VADTRAPGTTARAPETQDGGQGGVDWGLSSRHSPSGRKMPLEVRPPMGAPTKPLAASLNLWGDLICGRQRIGQRWARGPPRAAK
jgi:hypothetical protein